MTRRLIRSVVLVALAAMVAAGCATGRAFARGEAAGQAGDWESAVGFYRQALEDDPDRPDYKIALERAMVAAAAMYAERGRQFETAGQLEEALRAFRKAQEFEPSNRQLSSKAAQIDRTLRDRLEAAQPRPDIERLRQEASRRTEPILSPSNPEPLIVNFVNTSIRDILTFIGNYSGINVTFDRDFQDRAITLKLEGVSLEQALQQIMIANQLFYRTLSDRTIIVAADNTQKRTQYEEQVIRTFFVSHADATELSQLLVGLIRVAGMAIQPQIVANKTTNTITIRATAPVVKIAERVIDANDKPRAEVMVDVQILEVSRERTKNYGLDLGSYSMALNFSPESAPAAESKPFNLNTVSQGVSTSDFYLSVPSAVVRFLESDSQTKVLAKPNLRGVEGQKLSLNLGEDVPVPSTTFTPLAGTGVGSSPLTSYGYRTIGIIVDMTPRVTYDGDIILEITVENSARGQDTNIAGQNLPSFFSRKVATKLRLRDGESNLLAGLLREDERKSLTGFPGIMRLPIVKQLFSNNDNTIKQTDIVMLLTPRIIRTHELRAQDLSPIYIGTQSNMSLTGPPATIGAGAAEPADAPPAAQGPAGLPVPTAGTVPPVPTAAPSGTQPAAAPVLPTGSTQRPVVPPTSSPIPGMVMPPAVVPAPPVSNVQIFSPPPDPPAMVTPPPAPTAPVATAPRAPAVAPAPSAAAPVPAFAAAPAPPATELRSVRFAESDNGYAITLTGNGQLFASAVAEAQDLPARVLLDFHDVSAGTAPAITNVKNGDIDRIRVATNSRNPLITRVVIDLARMLPFAVEPTGNDLRVMFRRADSNAVIAVTPGQDLAPQANLPPVSAPTPKPNSRAAALTPAADLANVVSAAPAPTPTPLPPAPAAPAPAAPAPAAPPPAAAPDPGAAAPPATTPGMARITLSPPGEMRIGSGPYTVPISIAGASRISTLTVSITYNPALIRVRSVQEGTFMKQGGITPAFGSQIDDTAGRIDIVITRPGDKTGASTSGLLAALMIEPIVAGSGSLSLSGSGSVPGGASMSLQFLPAGVTVR